MAESTTLVRRQLGVRLKRLREQAGKTIADVEAASGVGSPSKLWRIESGRSSVRAGDVRELCALYGTSDPVMEALLGLARATKADGWREEYADVGRAGFGLYLGLEAQADAIGVYDPELVPGLVRTGGYQRALALLDPEADSGHLQYLDRTRRDRHAAAFEREPACRFSLVLGEGALHRRVGSAAVMSDQVRYLLELVDRERIEVRVLTWGAGAHRGLRGGGFTLMDFDCAEDPDLVYIEGETAARYLEQEAELDRYRDLWAALHRQSVPLRDLLGH